MKKILILVLFIAATNLYAVEARRAYIARNSYVVVTTKETSEDPAWRKAADLLRAKYDADMVICEGELHQCVPVLKKIRPNYVCFVLKASEAGRKTVVAIHRFLRELDDDPYMDCIWSILTGYEAADAVRIAEHGEPLMIDSAAGSMGPGVFEHMDSGFACSEVDKSTFWIKHPGKTVEEQTMEVDAVKALVDAFNNHPPDAFETSAHATEHNWKIGYREDAGYFKHDDGQLYGEDTRDNRYDITSPVPKIYMPMGNCLIGHVLDKDCMTTSWIHTGGAYQMFGYVEITFHGWMGWGTGKYFKQTDCTLAEAFVHNHHSLIHDLHTRFPKYADEVVEPFHRRSLRKIYYREKMKDWTILGHLWDKDAVAFYGDPAWIAKWPDHSHVYRWTVDRRAESFRVTLEILKDAKLDRPFVIPMDPRISNVIPGTCTAKAEPVFMDNFVLLPAPEEVKAGETFTITFGAKTVERKPTSARSEPVTVAGKKKGDA